MPVWFNFTRGFKANFKVGKTLGEGAYGCTHLCVEKATGQRYAVKVLAKSSIATEADMQAIVKEVKILQTVSSTNDNIVTLFGVFEDEEAVYLLMELCTGGELFLRIKDAGTFSEADAAHIIRQVLRVTAECHLNGICHRDLKPENFLYVSPGSDRIKAIDFGLSDFFEPDTRFSSIVGSPYYVAPEVLKRRYGPMADVWSVGVMCYVLLCGSPPFWGETDEELFENIINAPLDLELAPWPSVSEGAKNLLSRLLSKDDKLRMSASQALSHPWVREGGAAPDIPLCYDIINSLDRFSKQSALKRLFFSCFAKGWENTHTMQELSDQFRTLDKDGSGSVTHQEFQAALNSMKTGEDKRAVLDEDRVQAILKSLDADGDGDINYEEFLAAVIHNLKLTEDEEWTATAQKAFRSIDADGNGVITIEELQRLLPTPREDLEVMVREVDHNGDGQVDFSEFKMVLKDRRLRSFELPKRPSHLVGSAPYLPKAVPQQPSVEPSQPYVHSTPRYEQQQQQVQQPQHQQHQYQSHQHQGQQQQQQQQQQEQQQAGRFVTVPAPQDALVSRWVGQPLLETLMKEVGELDRELRIKKKALLLRKQQRAAREKVAAAAAKAREPLLAAPPPTEAEQKKEKEPSQPPTPPSTPAMAEDAAPNEEATKAVPDGMAHGGGVEAKILAGELLKGALPHRRPTLQSHQLFDLREYHEP
eukprot:CAMPEP_0117666762 /NCGR_PEP_ID=MMETSP0804-20121206/10562_1 /TAXON_ID=1074897 /ORGANISM="Tetraselmis astigmatica, Strain CCMP880" /LENGTH=701 /DNA_ID=CAMNT_0005474355 /DNA_START=320 /DNA_END=2425 /DNA_ORIENTATION=-